MITFERSKDYALIRQIMTHSRIWRHITDDFSPSHEDFEPIQNDAIWYVMAKKYEVIIGLWVLIPDNHICWKIHTCLLPVAWGGFGLEAALQLPEWLWEHTECVRIITEVPEYNRVALKFAKAANMQQFGVNERAYMKHGRLQNLILLGISKPIVASASPDFASNATRISANADTRQELNLQSLAPEGIIACQQ